MGVLDGVVLGVLFFAALEDIRGMQVRNVYPGILLFVSLIRVALTRPPFLLAIMHPLVLFVVLYVFWRFNGIGGADVKILSAMAVGEGMGIWAIVLISCFMFIGYALILRKPRQALPFIPAVLVGALVEDIFLVGKGYFG